MSLAGSERANRWRLDGALRRDQARLRTKVCDLMAAISRATGDIEVGANNEQQFLATSTDDADDRCRSQQLTRNEKDDANELQARALPSAVQIHVDTCGDAFDSLPPAPVIGAGNPQVLTKQLATLHFDRPQSRSASSIDLRTCSGGAHENWNGNLTRPAGNQMEQGSELDLLLLSVRPQPNTISGSLSDGAYKLTQYPKNSRKLHKPFSKRRFETWKRANKIITNIRENPLGLHLDCLDKLETFRDVDGEREMHQADDGKRPDGASVRSVREQTTQTVEDKGQQPKDLTNYANNLSHLYRKNRESMNSSEEFRGLLYNIICCLLVQDEQVLATASVGKMLDVIRMHLDSASRVYARTSGELLRNLSAQSVAEQQQQVNGGHPGQRPPQVAHSGQQESTVAMMASELKQSAGPVETTKCLQESDATNPRQTQKQKPADFRRISSVSFNDEQLIKDLRDERQERDSPPVRRSGSLSAESSNRPEPSPWAYRELSDWRENGPNRLNSAGSSCQTPTPTTNSSTTPTSAAAAAHYTSQSSLEQATNNSDGLQMDLMNDSGNGTMCDSQVVSDFAGYGNEAQRRRRRASLQSGGERRAVSLCSESFQMMGGLEMAKTAAGGECQRGTSKRRLSEFKPMQQPSYMSTDDYLSTTNNFNRHAQNQQRTSFYEDENSSAQLQKCDFSSNSQSFEQLDEEKCPSDAAARRAELEWTLNKLINIELKLNWLTSRDTLRRAIRKIGVPNEIRGKVWLILIDQMIGSKYNVSLSRFEPLLDLSAPRSRANANNLRKPKPRLPS